MTKIISTIFKKTKNYSFNIFQKFRNKIFGSKLVGNLGKTNIDNATLEYLIEKLKISSFLDLGFGKGGMVFNAISKGLYARGVEGDLDSIPVDWPLIFNVDYRNSFLNFHKKFDLCWSVEVLELIPEKFLDNIFKDIKNCKYALVTAAPPGWGGDGHVNEQNEEYWLEKFNRYGFQIDNHMTKMIRAKSIIKFGGVIRKQKKQFIQNRGLFFRNKLFL